jgi:hypothetical protein
MGTGPARAVFGIFSWVWRRVINVFRAVDTKLRRFTNPKLLLTHLWV